MSWNKLSCYTPFFSTFFSIVSQNRFLTPNSRDFPFGCATTPLGWMICIWIGVQIAFFFTCEKKFTFYVKVAIFVGLLLARNPGQGLSHSPTVYKLMKHKPNVPFAIYCFTHTKKFGGTILVFSRKRSLRKCIRSRFFFNLKLV